MPEETGQLSPDGYWWWDGGQWVSTVSPDGRWRWDGQRWVVNDVPVRYAGAFRFLPTADTRRLQVAVTVYLVAAAVLGVALLPITFNHSMQVSLATSTEPDPAVMQGFINVLLGFTIAFVLVWDGLLLLGTWKLWRWIYYVLMVLGVLSLFSLLTNSLALAGVSTYSYIPAWSAGLNILVTIGYLALTVWMFVLWRRYKTAWATRAEPI